MNKIKSLYEIIDIKNKISIIFLIFSILIYMMLEIASLSILYAFLNSTALQNDSKMTEFILTLLMKININFKSEDTVFILLISFVTIFLIKNLVLLFTSFKETKIINYLRSDVARTLLFKYLSLPYEFYFSAKSSEIIKNIVEETNHFCLALLSLIRLFLESITFAAIIIYLLVFNFKITLIIFSFFFIFSLSFYIFNRKQIVSYGKIRPTLISRRLKYLQEILGNIKIIKLNNTDNSLVKDFNDTNYAISHNAFKTTFLNNTPRPVFEIFVVIFLFISFYILNKSGLSLTSSVPLLGLYIAAGYKLLPSISRILIAMQQIEYNIQGIDSISKNYKEIDKIRKKFNLEGKPQSYEKINFKKEIEIKNVFFKYNRSDEEKYVLSNINLLIKKNKHIGIEGKTGEGKSTLIDLILGLIKPNRGSILVDGQNINNNFSHWQNMIGYVPQETFLNASSIKSNIAYGVVESNIEDDKVIKASEMANIYNFIKSLPEGMNTEVGENGIKLSGGQKQRLSIARALYKDPEIIIFDEATSSLDVNTEREIIEAINNLKKHKTLISISHKKTTMLYCDEIYEIKNSKLTKKDVQQ